MFAFPTSLHFESEPYFLYVFSSYKAPFLKDK